MKGSPRLPRLSQASPSIPTAPRNTTVGHRQHPPPQRADVVRLRAPRRDDRLPAAAGQQRQAISAASTVDGAAARWRRRHCARTYPNSTMHPSGQPRRYRLGRIGAEVRHENTSWSWAAASADCRRSRRSPGRDRGPGHPDRPPQLPPVPAAQLPGRHRRPGAVGHRDAAAPHLPPPAARPGAAGRGHRLRPRAAVRCCSMPAKVLGGTTLDYDGADRRGRLRLLVLRPRGVALGARSRSSRSTARSRSAAGSCMPSRPPSSTLKSRTSWLTFVVVGAGPTGVEMAGQIAELARDTLAGEFRRDRSTARDRVLLVETTDRVLGAFPEPLPARAARSLEQLGVTSCARPHGRRYRRERRRARGARRDAGDADRCPQP